MGKNKFYRFNSIFALVLTLGLAGIPSTGFGGEASGVQDYLDSNYGLSSKTSKYNSCGQNCRYERASEVASQVALYETGKADPVVDAIQEAQASGDWKSVEQVLRAYAPADFITHVCQGKADVECGERFVEYQANLVRNSRKTISTSEEMVLRLKAQEAPDWSSAGNVSTAGIVTKLGVFPQIQFGKGEAKLPQISRFKTVKDLRDTMGGKLGDLSPKGTLADSSRRIALDIYQPAEFVALDQQMLVEPSREDFILFERVDKNDPNNTEERLVMSCRDQKDCECAGVKTQDGLGYQRAFCFKKKEFEAAHQKWRVATGKQVAPKGEKHRLQETVQRLKEAGAILANEKTKRDYGTLDLQDKTAKGTVTSDRLDLFRGIVKTLAGHSQKLNQKVQAHRKVGVEAKDRHPAQKDSSAPKAFDDYVPDEGKPGDANTHVSYDTNAIDESLQEWQARTGLKL